MKSTMTAALALIAFLFAFTSSSLAVQFLPDLLYGTDLNDLGYKIRPTSDGGFIVAGFASAVDADEDEEPDNNMDMDGDMIVVKYNALRAVDWSRAWDRGSLDHATDVRQTSDGGYLVVGITEDPREDYKDINIYLIKLNYFGVELWQKQYGYNGRYDNFRDVSRCVIEVDDGYLIVGKTMTWGSEVGFGYDALILMVDKQTGAKKWHRTFGQPGCHECFYSAEQTSDNGLILCGFKDTPNNGEDIWLVKLDSAGTIEFDTQFGEAGNDRGFWVQEINDDGDNYGYIIAGWNAVNGFDGWLIKTDGSGNSEWDRFFGNEYDDKMYYVQQTDDGGYVLTGYKSSAPDPNQNNHSDTDLMVIKTDSEGNVIWQRAYTDGGDSRGYCVQQAPSGNYYATGFCVPEGLVDGDREILILQAID